MEKIACIEYKDPRFNIDINTPEDLRFARKQTNFYLLIYEIEKKQKSLYLGGGFRDHQILYMIPIIIGTCKRYKIKKIILEKKIKSKN